MSFAELNIWVSELDDPCKKSSRTWYINIYNCDGTILQWCDFNYVAIPARCGHRTIRVPPGCYRINAVWSFTIFDGFYRVNHFTDSVVVQACCDKHQCVTLFNPDVHRCGTIFLAAIQDAVIQRAVPDNIAQDAQRGVRGFLNHIGEPKDPLTDEELKRLEEMVRHAEESGEDPGTGIFPKGVG